MCSFGYKTALSCPGSACSRLAESKISLIPLEWPSRAGDASRVGVRGVRRTPILATGVATGGVRWGLHTVGLMGVSGTMV
jgi:hypothetical protein